MAEIKKILKEADEDVWVTTGKLVHHGKKKVKKSQYT